MMNIKRAAYLMADDLFDGDLWEGGFLSPSHDPNAWALGDTPVFYDIMTKT